MEQPHKKAESPKSDALARVSVYILYHAPELL
jgi:hypothetical protein